MEQKNTYQSLSKMCLNNWHYIDKKVLSFNKEINFFTGHSGSGKSTIIDALQIVLYANTDGRAFFNKAAADDSDRNLIEYLRGMITIGENNEFSYLRNKDFSTTIVLELCREDTGERQCVGVVFDVDTSTNRTNRLFFWHKGGLLEHDYRDEKKKRALSIKELKKELNTRFNSEECYYGSHNERFRKQLYDCYLGGLDKEKFPLLFKRAIPFRMNIRLEDFVKEYICMEQDIHIEEMQESVMQYGMMRRKIEDTGMEIKDLAALEVQYHKNEEEEKKKKQAEYFSARFDVLSLREKEHAVRNVIEDYKKQIAQINGQKQALSEETKQLEKEQEELLKRIAASGYEELKEQKNKMEELLLHLRKSGERWEETASGLKKWCDREEVPNSLLWDIEHFEKKEADETTFLRMQKQIHETVENIREEKQDTEEIVKTLEKEEKKLYAQQKQLKQGKKVYPKELTEARSYLIRRLEEETGEAVSVEILADILEVESKEWRNAVEGYMGNNKLVLVTAPEYVERAMEIYKELDKRRFHKTAVLDTQRIDEKSYKVKKGSLAEEVTARYDYAQKYVDYLLGSVMKCENVKELRKCSIGVTKDGMLYHSFRLKYMNEEDYTRRAYIGEQSMREQSRQLDKRLAALSKELTPHKAELKELEKVLQFERFNRPVKEYAEWAEDMRALKEREVEKQQLEEKIKEVKAGDIGKWEEEQDALKDRIAHNKAKREKFIAQSAALYEKSKEQTQRSLQLNSQLSQREKQMEEQFGKEDQAAFAQPFDEYLKGKETPNHERLRDYFTGQVNQSQRTITQNFDNLIEMRMAYLKKYPNRTFSATAQTNERYEALADTLKCDHLERYREIAVKQARTAMEHFKDDFIFKIRSAIREALERKDELNKIISRLDFGKDRYEFVITKNKGDDGRYFDMFMDESLEVNPTSLTDRMEDQMNLFTMEHEHHYGELMNDLISFFIPPENATSEQLEEAKLNMQKYADYRTYLSFDMQQIIEGDGEKITIQLSRMLKKNSGGEGQNPLYVALLASFAQAYHINESVKGVKKPSIRLVVLDEAFSKMDSEKVASCIKLIRGLGFQAIISATNDKIQNYLENVDKTFVFANADKKCISIQEFEKQNFTELQTEDAL